VQTRKTSKACPLTRHILEHAFTAAEVVVRIVAIALVLGFAAGGAAQTPSPLDTRVTTFRLPNPLPPCGIVAGVGRLRQRAAISIGFEVESACVDSRPQFRSSPTDDDLDGLTVRDVLDRLVAMVPAYQWREVGGIVVIRPALAWDDPREPLNL
jgi:hypothetical protein